MNNNDIKKWNLIGKYLNGEADASETERVEKLMNESDEFRIEVEKDSQMLNKIDLYYQSKKFNSINALPSVKIAVQPDSTKIKHIKKETVTLISVFKRYAAIILILLTLGFVAYYSIHSYQSNQNYSEITTAENQILKSYILPDGTSVALNASTKLKFDKNFGQTIREVSVVGEAFFDVVPNREKPFVIHAGDAQVKVLGTSFNVCAYPADEKVDVLVETGTVRVSCDNENSGQKPEVILTAGEKGSLFTDNNRIEKTINGDKNLLAWKTGILEFRETPLADVIKHLQKTYHIKIDVKQDELNKLPLTARFDEKPAKFILDVIRLTFDLDLSMVNDVYFLSKKTESKKH